MLANPSVFFLDEPTSGLDPGLDRKMMLLLRNLADKGHTIVLVTHATNNINACDYVCFLAQGGRLAFFGPPDEAKTYFDKTDFAEIYSTLEPTEEQPDIPAQAEARFKDSPEYKKYVEGPLTPGSAGAFASNQLTSAIKQPKRGNPWKQFWLLSRRYLELLWNDKGNFAILILQAPIIGLILLFLAEHGTFEASSIATCPPQRGIPDTSGNPFSCQNVVNSLNTPQGQVFMQQHHFTSVSQAVQTFIPQGSGGDAQKILFIIAFAAVMFGCINGAREIVKEAAIYKRERSVNLGLVPYMFSKIAVLGVLCLLQSAILVFFVNAKAPFHVSIFLPPLVEIYITMALTALAGLMVGLTVSALVTQQRPGDELCTHHPDPASDLLRHHLPAQQSGATISGLVLRSTLGDGMAWDQPSDCMATNWAAARISPMSAPSSRPTHRARPSCISCSCGSH